MSKKRTRAVDAEERTFEPVPNGKNILGTLIDVVERSLCACSSRTNLSHAGKAAIAVPPDLFKGLDQETAERAWQLAVKIGCHIQATSLYDEPNFETDQKLQREVRQAGFDRVEAIDITWDDAGVCFFTEDEEEEDEEEEEEPPPSPTATVKEHSKNLRQRREEAGPGAGAGSG